MVPLMLGGLEVVGVAVPHRGVMLGGTHTLRTPGEGGWWLLGGLGCLQRSKGQKDLRYIVQNCECFKKNTVK